MRILIADGSRVTTERLIDLMLGIPSVELLAPTATGKATLESVRAHDPEVLVIDAGILDEPGVGLLQAVRIEKPAAVVIILSNLFYPQYQKHYESAGADLFMDKSYEFVHLYQLLRELVCAPQAADEEGSKGRLRKLVAHTRLRVALQVCLAAFSVSSFFVSP